MYRLLEKSGQTAKQQAPGKSNRQRSGRPAGKPEEGAVEKPPAELAGRPVTSAGTRKRHSKKWRFARLGPIEMGEF
jgi:hypothetical protein